MLAKTKLNSKEVLISKALIDSASIHDEFLLINNTLKEYKEMKNEIKDSRHNQVWAIYKSILSCYCLKCRKNTESKNLKVCFYQNAQCVIVKNQNLLDNKKLVDY